jgi:alpha-galactosidase
MALALTTAAAILACASALDNGFRKPALGWSSWYGFTSNIDEVLLRETADGLVSSGLFEAGFNNVWIDDGFVLPRNETTHELTVDPAVFPSGMRAFSDYVHARGLKLGVYTSIGPLTCLGNQPTQPKRPGSCGFEAIDAELYANDWQIDQLKDDGCGPCTDHDPYVAMRDALNATGRHILFSIHAGTTPGSPNATVSNDWRTGDDLYSSTFDMWTNRLDLATTPEQAALVGPGSFANPDFLEVGYSPRAPKGNGGVMSALEQRSMFTMWAALPTHLILSADVRPNATSGGIDADALATLTNLEVISVNQDDLSAPMRIVSNSSDGATQVWRKPLAAVGAIAVILFHRGAVTTGPVPAPPVFREISASWSELGLPADASVDVRDLWLHADLGVFSGSFAANVTQRDAQLYTFTVRSS